MNAFAFLLAVIYAFVALCQFLVGLALHATAIHDGERHGGASLAMRAPLWPLDLLVLIAQMAATLWNEDRR